MLEGMPLESLGTGARYHVIISIMVGGARESGVVVLAVGGWWLCLALALTRDRRQSDRLTILDRFWGNERFWGLEN